MTRAVLLLALLAQEGAALAQGDAARSANRAADIKASDIQAAIAQATAKDPNRPPDTPIRTVDGGGAHVVGVVVTHRPKGSSAGGSGGTHEKVTEVYHVLEGSGTLVTDGTMINPRRSEGGQYGPGVSGDSVQGSVTRRIAKGDTIIIPPGVPHRLSEVHEDITILVLTVDPERVIKLRSQ
jgi:mannose-6-phosphate isomerase-like protein (cupin superfamily)